MGVGGEGVGALVERRNVDVGIGAGVTGVGRCAIGTGQAGETGQVDLLQWHLLPFVAGDHFVGDSGSGNSGSGTVEITNQILFGYALQGHGATNLSGALNISVLEVPARAGLFMLNSFNGGRQGQFWAVAKVNVSGGLASGGTIGEV